MSGSLDFGRMIESESFSLSLDTLNARKVEGIMRNISGVKKGAIPLEEYCHQNHIGVNHPLVLFLQGLDHLRRELIALEQFLATQSSSITDAQDLNDEFNKNKQDIIRQYERLRSALAHPDDSFEKKRSVLDRMKKKGFGIVDLLLLVFKWNGFKQAFDKTTPLLTLSETQKTQQESIFSSKTHLESARVARPITPSSETSGIPSSQPTTPLALSRRNTPSDLSFEFEEAEPASLVAITPIAQRPTESTHINSLKNETANPASSNLPPEETDSDSEEEIAYGSSEYDKPSNLGRLIKHSNRTENQVLMHLASNNLLRAEQAKREKEQQGQLSAEAKTRGSTGVTQITQSSTLPEPVLVALKDSADLSAPETDSDSEEEIPYDSSDYDKSKNWGRLMKPRSDEESQRLLGASNLFLLAERKKSHTQRAQKVFEAAARKGKEQQAKLSSKDELLQGKRLLDTIVRSTRIAAPDCLKQLMHHVEKNSPLADSLSYLQAIRWVLNRQFWQDAEQAERLFQNKALRKLMLTLINTIRQNKERYQSLIDDAVLNHVESLCPPLSQDVSVVALRQWVQQDEIAAITIAQSDLGHEMEIAHQLKAKFHRHNKTLPVHFNLFSLQGNVLRRIILENNAFHPTKFMKRLMHHYQRYQGLSIGPLIYLQTIAETMQYENIHLFKRHATSIKKIWHDYQRTIKKYKKAYGQDFEHVQDIFKEHRQFKDFQMFCLDKTQTKAEYMTNSRYSEPLAEIARRAQASLQQSVSYKSQHRPWYQTATAGVWVATKTVGALIGYGWLWGTKKITTKVETQNVRLMDRFNPSKPHSDIAPSKSS